MFLQLNVDKLFFPLNTVTNLTSWPLSQNIPDFFHLLWLFALYVQGTEKKGGKQNNLLSPPGKVMKLPSSALQNWETGCFGEPSSVGICLAFESKVTDSKMTFGPFPFDSRAVFLCVAGAEMLKLFFSFNFRGTSVLRCILLAERS